jgi:hypothetical protein
LPGVAADDATDQVEAALRWVQEHNRDRTAAKVDVPAVRSDHSILGEVIRIVASVSPTPAITETSEWIGRLTGDSHQPALTMRWAHKGVGSPVACRKS